MKEERRNSKVKKIVFMGTPLIATFALKALIDLGHEIVCVVSQPDKLSGREKKVIFSDVKTFSLNLNLPFVQPKSMDELFNFLKKIKFDYIFTCAYGNFISDNVLSLPKIAAVNMHASLLPKYRGGAPIHWSIINQDKATGISLIKMEKKMDAGVIYFQKELKINSDDTTFTLTKKMANLIYDSIISDFGLFVNNKLKEFTQNENEVTFALNIKREQEQINWNQDCKSIDAFIRGLYDKPLAFTIINNIEIKILKAETTNIESFLLPGTISNISAEGIFVSTATMDLKIIVIKISGRKAMCVKDFINGNRIFTINSKFS